MRCPREPDLEALARGALDDAAKGELEAHVAGCATCKPELRRLRAVKGLLAELPELAPTELEWKRIDKHVVEAMLASASRPSPWSIGSAAAATVALAAGLALLVITRPTVPPSAPLAHREAPAAMALALATGGQAHTPHAPQIQEGDELRTSEGTLEIQTAAATGIALTPHSVATATRLRAGETDFALAEGELLSEVKPLTAGQSFQVHAGDLTVHVVGTAFVVGRTPHSVRVAVLHGRVRVDRSGQPGFFEVAGGTEATVADGQALSTVLTSPLLADPAAHFPLAFPDLAPEAVALQYRETSIDSTPGGAQASLDGADRGQTPLTLLTSEGSHDLDLSLAGHPTQRARFEVGQVPGSTRINLPAAAVEPEPAPTPLPAPAPAHLPRRVRPSEVAAPAPEPVAVAVLEVPTFLQAFADASKTYQPEVERCFATNGGSYPRELHLQVSVQPDGHVAPPIATDDVGVDFGFLDCVNKAARDWTFPVSGLAYDTTLPFKVSPGN